MMVDEDKINALIMMLYDAALEDALWPSLVREVSSLMQAADSLLFSPIITENNEQLILSLYEHADNDAWEAYSSYFWRHDIWSKEYRKHGFDKSGAVIHSDKIVERSAFRQSEMYNDFLKPMHEGMGINLCAVISDGSVPEASLPMVLTFYKPSFAEAFSPQDEHLIRQLLPHFQRALRIRWKMVEERQMCQLREMALDHINTAVLLLDVTGKVLFANRKAEAVLSQKGNPTVMQGRFCGVDNYENNAIKHALRQAEQGIGITLRLNNRAPLESCVATFSPVAATRAEHLRIPARIMVMITEPVKYAASGDLGAFAKLYRLTPAEARVLKHLLQQQSTREIAETLHISMTTLRTQLSALFAKTHTKNQRELIKFCLSHPMVGV
ncbi:MAG: LuxR C-terminal-related transcriptional regulator [Methylomicrobium sp.]|jgi:DNA-binding CsgD family transcriptional regulator/PAS domain-containing protein